MKKSIFKIAQMDCPSEEQLIRLKLDGVEAIKHLHFDLDQRKLTVVHGMDDHPLLLLIEELKLGATLLSSEVTEDVINHADQKERRVLWAVLAINFSFFLIEMFYGWLSHSMGLIADSLDMLSDSFVYVLSLMVVGQALLKKKRVAMVSGYLQVVLAVLGLIEVIRRFFGAEALPSFGSMIIVSFFALIANAVSLYLLQKEKSQEVHMQASTICTSNDVIMNMGIILAGVLVYFTHSHYPDLIIGSIVFVLVIKGSMRILRLSKAI